MPSFTAKYSIAQVVQCNVPAYSKTGTAIGVIPVTMTIERIIVTKTGLIAYTVNHNNVGTFEVLESAIISH